MADVTPDVLTNAVLGKLLDVLTNGDATVPKSTDNFFSWCTPGIPVTPEDFRFLSQGLTGVVTPQAAQTLAAAAGAGASGTSTTTAASPGSGSSTPAPAPALTPDQLNQLRAQDVNAVYQQAEMLARMVDFVPDLTAINNQQFALFSVANNNGTLSDCYTQTLQMSQVMAQQLDQATQDKIAKFRGLMQTTTQKTDLVTGAVTNVVGPSPLVQAYNQKMAAYDSAALQYNAARIDALAGNNPAAVENWAINASILRNQVIAAMDDWITNGYKNDYEEIAAYISQVMQRDMSLLKAQYEQDLQNARLTGISSGSDFFYTALAPADFATSLGWSQYTFNSGDFSRYTGTTFNQSGWQAQAGATYLGLVSVGGNASGSTSGSTYNGTFHMDTFNLSFEICQVPILRPWFKDAYLNSKDWRFDQSNPDFKSTLLSDGGNPPKGLIPAYPTNCVFIRNLNLQIDQSSSAASYIQQQTASAQSGGGAVSIGPFALGGSASHYSKSGYSQSNFTSTWDDQGLHIPGMQLVGYKCHVLTQKCPNPDPSITAWV
jgi:hypothetical protein